MNFILNYLMLKNDKFLEKNNNYTSRTKIKKKKLIIQNIKSKS